MLTVVAELHQFPGLRGQLTETFRQGREFIVLSPLFGTRRRKCIEDIGTQCQSPLLTTSFEQFQPGNGARPCQEVGSRLKLVCFGSDGEEHFLQHVVRPCENVEPAYQLNWGLTVFWRQTAIPDGGWLASLQAATEPDGVRVLKHRITTNGNSLFFVSTKPHVAPKELIRSVKGRPQHELRQQVPKAFQRNYCLRSIGAVTREVIEAYVASQLGHHRMADPAVQERLARFQKCYPNVDLKEPAFTSHGEYWYNLHLVIVNDERWMEIREPVLEKLLVTVERAASKHGHRLSRAAMLPDHVHLTLGCEIGESPEDVAIEYLNNCAYAYGMMPVYRFSYYVGTFGEYDRGAV